MNSQRCSGNSSNKGCGLPQNIMSEISQNDVLRKLVLDTNKVVFTYEVDSAAITFLNAAFSSVWKRTRESVMTNSASILDTIHPDDKDYLVKEYLALINGKIKKDIEFRIILPDGAVKYMLLSPLLITDKQGKKVATGFVDDITVRKETIRYLEKYGAKKNSILVILSHDLAGPLANIQVMADLLYETAKDYKDSRLDNIIKVIKDSSTKNVKMIRDFVQQEFLESSQVDLYKERVNLVKRVKHVIEQYKDGENHIQKDIRFTSSSDKIYIHIDETKFMQVINNLFSNAIKFTHDNGVISIDLSEQETSVLVTVKDNGIGIPARYHDELFEKFTRARREGLRGEPSTGLGMYIIKTIVEWHKGKIWFKSEENVGSTFFIEIPKE